MLSNDLFHAMATPPLPLISLGLQNSGYSSGGCAEAWKVTFLWKVDSWFSSYVCSQCSEIAIMCWSFRILFMVGLHPPTVLEGEACWFRSLKGLWADGVGFSGLPPLPPARGAPE